LGQLRHVKKEPRMSNGGGKHGNNVHEDSVRRMNEGLKAQHAYRRKQYGAGLWRSDPQTGGGERRTLKRVLAVLGILATFALLAALL